MVVYRIGLFLALVVLAGASAIAQPPGELPIQPDLATRAFTIRIVNGSQIPIYYKLAGGPGRAYVHQTLPPGRSETERGVTGGDKALCVWQANEQTLLAVWIVRVDRNGKIVIPPLVGAMAAPRAGEAPAAPSPRLPVVPE